MAGALMANAIMPRQIKERWQRVTIRKTRRVARISGVERRATGAVTFPDRRRKGSGYGHRGHQPRAEPMES
jgi:hypothetical protein